MWIDASGIETELLWSLISSFLKILVEITDSSSATNSVSESLYFQRLPHHRFQLSQSMQKYRH